MCGIVGIVTNAGKFDWTKRRDFFTDALVVDTIRGHHGTGVYCVPAKGTTGDKKKIVYTHKKAVAGTEFVKDKTYAGIVADSDEYKYMIGHNRYATQGKKDDKGAHPFFYDQLALVHNGSIWESGGLPKYHEFAIDSEWITYLLATMDHKEVFKNLRGAFALVWYSYKDGYLRIARNKERPLWWGKVKDNSRETLLIASEDWMIHGLATRNKYDLVEVKQFQTEVLYKLDETGIVSEEKLDFFVPPVYQYEPFRGYSGGTGTSGNGYSTIPKKKPHVVQGAECKAFLKSKGLKLGQRVSFSITRIEYKNKKSRHGNVYGIEQKTDMKQAVFATGIVKGRFAGDFLINGTICGLENSKPTMPRIALSGLKVTKKEDPWFRQGQGVYTWYQEEDLPGNITSNKQAKQVETKTQLAMANMRSLSADERAELREEANNIPQLEDDELVNPDIDYDDEELMTLYYAGYLGTLGTTQAHSHLRMRAMHIAGERKKSKKTDPYYDRGQNWTSDRTEKQEVGDLRGPSGLSITRTAYLKLVEGGCDQCSQPISVFDDHMINWTKDKHPICSDCSGSLKDSGVLLQ